MDAFMDEWKEEEKDALRSIVDHSRLGEKGDLAVIDCRRAIREGKEQDPAHLAGRRTVRFYVGQIDEIEDAKVWVKWWNAGSEFGMYKRYKHHQREAVMISDVLYCFKKFTSRGRFRTVDQRRIKEILDEQVRQRSRAADRTIRRTNRGA